MQAIGANRLPRGHEMPSLFYRPFSKKKKPECCISNISKGHRALLPYQMYPQSY